MDVKSFILVAAASLGFAIPVANAQDDEEVAAQSVQARGPVKPWKFVRGLGRVLDLSHPPVVIDEPGLYAIQRNWQFPQATTQVVTEPITITADNVVLNLHGFGISVDRVSAPPLVTLITITGSAEIYNGRLEACCEGAIAVKGGDFTQLHHLSIYSFEPMGLGTFATISDSDIYARSAVWLASHSNLERNAIGCSFICVEIEGDTNRVTDNRILPNRSAGVGIKGNGNIVANNVMLAVEIEQLEPGFEVFGNHNVLRNNTVLVGGPGVGTVWEISGTGNTLEGNIAAPHDAESRAGTGIRFLADGNYYGDNRMAAEVPFALSGTVQIDWGDNVGY